MAEMPRSEDLFLMLKRISWTLTAQLELRLKERNMRGTQVYFLVYLLRRHPQGTYLTELSREIGLSKSTLSPLIKRLRRAATFAFGKTRRTFAESGSVPPKSSWQSRGSFGKGRADGTEAGYGPKPAGKAPALASGPEAFGASGAAGQKRVRNRQEDVRT